MNLGKIIDHTILKPDCTVDDIKQVCTEASNNEFAAVCVPPFYVKEASHFLKDSPIKIATVIGFPMGYSTIPAKVEEIKRAINDGVDELDVVINICAVKSNNWNYVKNDIDSVTRISHMRGKTIKIIFEMNLLNQEQVKKLCEICNEFGVDYVKTSTGFQGGGATVKRVSLLREHLSSNIKIKASGGIKKRKDALALVEAGADRLGCSASLKLIEKEINS